MTNITTIPSIPPFDASEFTVAAIDEKEKREEEFVEEKKKEESSAKIRDKIFNNIMKPPPPAVIKEQIRQKEKMIHEAEEVEKRKIFAKIQLYFERFPGLMSKIPKISGRTSLPEAQEILNQIHHTMDSIGSCRAIVNYIDTGFTVLEGFMSDKDKVAHLPKPLQLNLTGISDLFRQGKFPELDPLIAEVDIEYPWLGKRSLILRVLGTFSDIATKVHLYNTNPAAKMIFEMGKRGPVDLKDE